MQARRAGCSCRRAELVAGAGAGADAQLHARGAGGAMLLTMVFFGGCFLGSVKRPNVQLSSPDRQEG